MYAIASACFGLRSFFILQRIVSYYERNQTQFRLRDEKNIGTMRINRKSQAC